MYFGHLLNHKRNRTCRSHCFLHVIGTFFLVMVTAIDSWSQTSELDRLTSVFETIPCDTELEIDSLNSVADQYTTSYPAVAEQFGERALDRSLALGYSRGEAGAYLNIAALNRTRSNLPKALESGWHAHNLYHDLSDSTRMAVALNLLGNIYKELNQMDSALAVLYRSMAVNARDLKTKGMTLNNIGSVYIEGNHYDSASKYYHMALEIRQEIKDLAGLGVTYGNLGILALERDSDFEGAKRYYQQSINIKLANRDLFNLAFSYINMGNLYRNYELFDTARTYYALAVNIADSAKAKGVQSAAYVRWARSERRAGNIAKAEEYDRLADGLYIEVLEERQQTELAQLQAGFQLRDKQRELQLRVKDIAILEKDKRLLFFQLTLLVICVVFLFVMLWFQNRRRKSDRELQIVRQAQLENEIETKNNELSLFTVNLIKKQQMMDELDLLSKKIKRQSSLEGVKRETSALQRIVNDQRRSDREWENFRVYFERVHFDFFKKMQAEFGDLTVNELRLAALIKMNLSIKETASILGIESDSVKTARSRLRSKLGLARDQNLGSFLMKF